MKQSAKAGQTELLKLRVSSDLRRSVEAVSRASGIGMSAFIRLAVNRAIKKESRVDSVKNPDTTLQSTN